MAGGAADCSFWERLLAKECRYYNTSLQLHLHLLIVVLVMLESLNAILLLFFYFQESESQSLQFYLIVKLKIYLGLRPNFDIWYELNFFSLND